MLKSKEIAKMNNKDMNEKIREMRKDMIKARVNASKSGKTNIRSLKKTIARMLTFKKLNKSKEDKKQK